MSGATVSGREAASVHSVGGVGLLRFAIFAFGGMLLLWLTLAVTLAMTVADPQPDLVLSFWPTAAIARADTAMALISPPRTLRQARADDGQALTLAGAALTREPVLAGAASALGAAATLGGNARSANTAYAYAQQLSRRDLQSQLWAVERAVGHGDVVGALSHYDVALRTSQPATAATLLPVMARASAGAAVRGPLIAMLARKPGWRLSYLQAMLAAALPPLPVAEQLAGARLDLRDPGQAAILSAGLAQLIAAKQYRLASTLIPGSAGRLRNGSFEQEPTLLPFDWWLASDEDLTAYREPSRTGEGAYVLRIVSKDRGGVVARQLVALPAGRWLLRGTAGDGEVGNTAPFVQIACAGSQGVPRATALLTMPTDGRQTFSLTFTVPDRVATCEAYWITISAPVGANVSGWIDTVKLRRVG